MHSKTQQITGTQTYYRKNIIYKSKSGTKFRKQLPGQELDTSWLLTNLQVT